MGKARDPDRFIWRRGGVYQYQRRVPAKLTAIDVRAPYVRVTLGTDDLALARVKRDALERADDDYWAALLMGSAPAGAQQRYEAAVRRAEGLGFAYRTAVQLAENVPLEELLARFDALSGSPVGSPAAEALLGVLDIPATTVRQAFEIYCSEIMPSELVGKSAVQRAGWKKVKARAVENFVKLIGDVPISSITREQARRFYRLWLDRVAPPAEDGKVIAPTHSASSGNRDVGNMRQLFGDYHKHIGDHDRQNPFAGFSFGKGMKRSRPPFSVDWMRSRFLRAGSQLHRINSEARGILLMMIETGARPSEIANLDGKTIVTKHPVPHIVIQPRDDPDDPREIKTTSSIRAVPLVGVSLAVAQAHPHGFPRYRNRETALSNALNKTLDAAGLLESPKHKPYSIRHAYEDRMKAGGFDEEMRRQVLGHVIDRPKYGSGFTLEQMQTEMQRIALPFAKEVV